MAHSEQLEYVKSLKLVFPHHFRYRKVLEVGSLDINGTVRIFFDNCDYTGLDLGEGKGVDLIEEGQNYDAPDETYDTVLSTECFEHNPYWKETFLNMIRLCKKNGLVFFTCATDGNPEHGTVNRLPGDAPLVIEKGWNYYKNLNKHDFNIFPLDDLFLTFSFSNNIIAHDLYFFGIKK
tara:strand:+ start:214 stop:747 length:534 start_codon:yes stop_codon:yes gene_type:complete